MEDIELLVDAPAAAPPARKLSRLRRAGGTPKPAPSDAPEAEDDGGALRERPPNDAQPRLATPQVAPSPSGSRRDAEGAAEQTHSVGGLQQPEEEEEEPRAGASYRDEEDELESFFERGGSACDDGAEASRAASDDESGPRSSGSRGGSDRGEERSMDWADLNADTQRVLRETASRDRLGRAAAEVEVKPLSSILDRIKQRQHAAIQRAAKPNLSGAPSFEEVFAAAQRNKGPAAAAAAPAAPAPLAAPGALPPASAAAAPISLASQLDSSNIPSGSIPVEWILPHNVETQAGVFSRDSAPEPAAEDVAAEQAGGAASPAAAKPSPFEQAQAGPGSPQQQQQQQQEPAVVAAEALGAAEEVAAASESDDEDLEIVSEGEAEEANIVELPSSTKKKRPRAFSQDIDFDEVEDVLIEDGYESDEPEEKEEEAVPGTSEEGPASAGPTGSEAEEAGSDEDEAQSSDAEQAADASEVVTEEQGVSQAEGEEAVGEDRAAAGSPAADSEAAEQPSGAAGDIGQREAKRQPKLKPMFLDMEAELSDEEGGLQTEDEEDDDLDDQGELADLIGTAKETHKDLHKRDELHRQWAEQQDAKELQQVLRGLKHGFRRRGRGGFMEEEDDEEGGRRRRARLEEDDEGDVPMDDVPAWFADAAGSDEDADDLDLLKRAQQRHVLGASQEELDRPSSIPLDENSQEVLSLLARSASEPQGPALLPQRSRFAPAGPLLGSEPQGPGGGGASRLGRGPSFVGRQPSVSRLHSGGLAGVGSKSFVFGRDDSNSAAPAADKDDEAAPVTGPTNFANLRQQLTGMGSSGPGGRGPKLPSATLVSRLAAPRHRLGKEPAAGSTAVRAVDAASAVFEQVVQGLGGKK